MNEHASPRDDEVVRMLRRRAVVAETGDLEEQTRAALGRVRQRSRIWVGLGSWLPRANLAPPRLAPPSLLAVAATAVVAIAVVARLGGIGVGPGQSAPSPSSSARPSPAVATPFPWPSHGLGEPVLPGLYRPEFWPPLSLRLPDGWYMPSFGVLVGLVPDTAANRAALRDGTTPPTFVDLFRNLDVAAMDCTDSAEPGVDETSAALLANLAVRDGLVIDGPIAVEIGGLSGGQLDVAIADDWRETCDGVPGPFVPLLQGEGLLWWGVAPEERFRIIVLDVTGLPEGMHATLTFVIYAADESDWDEHLSRSMPVVESFEFDTTPPAPGSL